MKPLKSIISILIVIAVIVFACPIGIAQTDEDSAGSRISFYSQYGIAKDEQGHYKKENGRYVPSKKAKKTGYDAIDLGLAVNNHTLLGAAGCSLFSGLHAYQWLFGKLGSDEMTPMAQKLVDMLKGGRPDKGGLGPSKAMALLTSKGAKTVSIPNSEAAIKDFFDATGGVICHNIPDGYGHYFISVGYTYHEINGKNTFLLHIVDSSNGTVAKCKKYSTYNMSFEKQYVSDWKIYPGEKEYNSGCEYWLAARPNIVWAAYNEEFISANTLEFRNVKYPAEYNCFVSKGKTTSNGFNVGGYIISDADLVSLDVKLYKQSDPDHPISVKEGIKLSGKVFFLSKLDNGQDNGQKFSKITEEDHYCWDLVAKDSAGRRLPLHMEFDARIGANLPTNTISLSNDDQINQTMPASSLELNKACIKLEPMQTETLTATIIPSNVINKVVVWSSSDESIATVDQNGTVTAISPGSATISVTTLLWLKTASCDVIVDNSGSTVEMVNDNLDEYHTAKGVRPDPATADGHVGFALEKINFVFPSVPLYKKPDTSSEIISNQTILSYFHVKAKVRNNGVLWYLLEDGSYVQAAKLSEEVWFTTAANVQLGKYTANVAGARWTKAPGDTPLFGTMAEGTEVNVIAAAYVPSLDMIWYRIKNGTEDRWLYAADYSLVAPAPEINIYNAKYPLGERREGLGFELKGKIMANEDIVSIEGAVYEQSGAYAVFSTQNNPAVITPNSMSVEIYDTAINTSLKFGDLSAGSYYYELKATTSSGYEKVLASSEFTVIGEDDPSLDDLDEYIPVSSLCLSAGNIELEQGDSSRIVAFAFPETASNPNVIWASSDPSVAVVNSDGYVRAIGDGTAIITASTVDGSGLSKQVTVTTTAAQPSAEGLEYTITDEKVYITGGTVSGTVRIPGTIEGYPVVSIRGLAHKGITSIYIPNTVTDMWGAFYQDNTIVYAYFEDGATVVPSQAFQAASLQYVYLPDSIEEIGYYAFTGCNLTHVDLPASLKKIGFNAFAGNTNLSDVVLPHGLQEMGDTVFSGTSITSIEIPNTVTSMILTFSGCDLLTNVYFEEGTTCIHDRAFSNAANVDYVYIPDSVTRIEGGAFGGCSHLTDISLPQGLTELYGAFEGTGITEIFIPQSVTTMNKAFGNNNNTLTSVHFEDGIMTIPDYALYGASSLEYVYIPDTVTQIGNSAFSGCTSLSDICLPSGLTRIGYNAFSKTAVASAVIPQGVTEMDCVYLDCEDLVSVSFEEGMQKIPAGALSRSSVQQVTIPSTVTIIEDRAFSGCNQLTEIELPAALETIGISAFENSGLISINLPDTITSIGSWAFRSTALSSVRTPTSWNRVPTPAYGQAGEASPFADCAMLTSIEVPEDATVVPEYAFATNGNSSTASIIDISLPGTLTTIGNKAFVGTGINTIVLPSSLISIGNEAFRDCADLLAVSFEPQSSLISIGDGAFENSIHLSSINLNELLSLQTIKTRAFMNCSDMSSIDLPDSVNTLGAWSFRGTSLTSVRTPANWTKSLWSAYGHESSASPFADVPSLTSIEVPEGATVLPESAFASNDYSSTANIVNISLPTTLTKIENRAFYGSGIILMSLPASLTSIGSNTFQNCANLCIVQFAPDSVLNTIGGSAFENCANLSSIELPDSITTIGAWAFRGTSLTSVRTPISWNRTTSSAYGADNSASPFAGCATLTSITVPEGATVLPENAFANNGNSSTANITEISLPGTLTRIERRSFAGTGIRSVRLPSGLVQINNNAFENCLNLSDVLIAGQNVTFGNNIFSNCSAITLIVLPQSNAIDYAEVNDFACHIMNVIILPSDLNTVEEEAFFNSACEAVIIPTECEAIGPKAFAYCSGLRYVRIPASVSEIAGDAFDHSDNVYVEFLH